MKTSLSTGCVAESRSRDTLGMSASCELFQGTITSDFGASSLPRIDIPDIFTSPAGGAAVLAEACGSALASPAVVLAEGFCARRFVASMACGVAGAFAANAGVLGALGPL